MATPADQRLLELLGRWLESLELHSKYSSLDDDSYWKVQPWSEHQRPTRWIVDLAKQKTLALRAQVEQRAKAGDTQFSDSLELMAFLANLVGAEHIERFIPVAEARNERDLSSKPADRRRRDSTIQQTGHRQPPRGKCPSSWVPNAHRRRPGTAQVARNERKPAAVVKPAPRSAGQGAAQEAGRASRTRRTLRGRPRSGDRRCGALGTMGPEMV